MTLNSKQKRKTKIKKKKDTETQKHKNLVLLKKWTENTHKPVLNKITTHE